MEAKEINLKDFEMGPRDVVKSLSTLLEGKSLSCPFGFDVVKFITSVSDGKDMKLPSHSLLIELDDGAKYVLSCAKVL